MHGLKIIAFLCTWCSYTGADTAGIARLKSPANIHAVRVPCSGRVSPELIMRTFDQGADGVLVLGCHIGECHYDSGNHRTAKRIPVLKSLLQFAGLEPQRLRLDWVSASEGDRFSRIVTEFAEAVRQLGPARWRVDGKGFRAVPNRFISQPALVSTFPPNKSFAQQAYDLRQTARDLLSNQNVDWFIGYEEDPRGRTRPTFIYRAEDSERLVWNQNCTHNLTSYLSQKLRQPQKIGEEQHKSRVAIVVKPCDSKAINVQLAEKAYDRDQVYIVGMACAGIKAHQRSNGYRQTGGNGQLQKRCQICTDRTPGVYDTLIGETVGKSADLPGISRRDLKITQLQAMAINERMDYWLSEFDRCIRCYACRQACPMCNCPTCLYERDDSLWIGVANGWDGIGLNEKRTFHLGRAYHLAGRCIGCDECERVCPMDIPISSLNQMLTQEVEALFKHRAGISPKPTPLITILSGEESLP